MDYWRALEETFCGRRDDPALAAVFPASAVPEVMVENQWTTRKFMSTKQRAALFTHIYEVRLAGRTNAPARVQRAQGRTQSRASPRQTGVRPVRPGVKE